MKRHPGSRALAGGLRAVAVLVIAAVAAAVYSPTANAAPRTVWVEQAGHTIDGLFLDAWRANAAFLGMPISEEFTARVPTGDGTSDDLIVQYFDNLALVYSPDDPRGAEWTVHALPLGAGALKADRGGGKLKSVDLADAATCGTLAEDSCRLFDETDQTVRYGFLDFWEANGAEQMIGLPLTEEFTAADGWTTQYFERAVLIWKKDRDVQARAIGAETAKRAKIDTAKVSQPLEVPVYDEQLFVEPEIQEIQPGVGSADAGPGPIQGGYKEIVVSVSQQTLWAYEDGELVISTLVSTGTGEVPETETPRGSFAVHTKYLTQTMEGTIAAESYRVEDVPWVMYFDYAGNALHGTYWHNNFGQRMSHGCVNLPLDVAEFLYGWAPEGTLVTVID